MSGLSERDVDRLLREVCPCGGDRAHDPARDLECDWSLRVVKSVAASHVLAERDAAIRDEAKAEALREAADEWETTEPLNHTYAHVKFFARELRNRAALLDGGDQS